jgi:ABC-type transporter MlaC component
VADVLGVINSGRSESAMLRDFERIFRDYADVPIIAQSVVGPPWRSASDGDRRAFVAAFQGYMARKYGRRFRDFIGGEITVTGIAPGAELRRGRSRPCAFPAPRRSRCAGWSPTDRARRGSST